MNIISSIPYLKQLKTALYLYKNFGIFGKQAHPLKGYITGRLFPEYSDELHLKETIEWLLRAQDACEGNGVSCIYSLTKGWGIAYPETSGYIIATFLAYAIHRKDNIYLERAVRLGEWEIDIQAPNGGIFSNLENRQIRIFNTGMVILGWCALFEQTREIKYLRAAQRAGDYLLRSQEDDGTWRKDTYCGPRTYHARVDWALLRLAQLSNEERYAIAAVKNIRWILSKKHETGWFSCCGFNDDLPIMHVIVYTLRGLLECSLMNYPGLSGLEIMPTIIKAADSLCIALERKPINNISGMIPASFDQNWESPDVDSCLTGNAQFTCFLYRLAQCTRDERYIKTANNVLSATKRTQLVKTSILPLRGAIAGTYPLSHGYLSNGFPNWAAKFFADALLMKINYAKKLVIQA